ncbi:NAD(+) diphosphatase [Chitiniphilus purpureus]|uniref:NAD(+) diphosphatase n=1 Tax=Chitiniphilus purpureus TaxID=2981137 RepID=A0ABY6DMM7_9NEIS|nr:NAD(+) diphosphatase [Chitiniphilus sp. CD1]UXY15625.1 NAD(+) diphosphatase [Chitiniphilus sp. CD1]
MLAVLEGLGLSMLPDGFVPGYRWLAAPLADALTLPFAGDALLFEQGLLLPALPQASLSLLVGHYHGRPVQALALPQVPALPVQALGLRQSHGLIEDGLWLMAGRASQLLTFHRTQAFCGVCGSATDALPDEACRVCPTCDHRVWPRVSPAVMVLIRRGRELLLARSPQFKAGVYSALAGFVEPGETLEACAHREVYEEVGLRIGNLRWFGSQSWPFPHSLMLAFLADYVEGEIVPQPGEIEDAAWFTPEALPDLPSRGSIAYRLIQAALAELPAPR